MTQADRALTLLIVTAGTCVSRAEPTAYRETGVTRTVLAPGSRSRDGPRLARPGPASSPTATSATAAQTPGLEFSILPPTPLLHSELSGQGRPPAAALTTPSGFDQNPSLDRTSLHSCPSHFEPRSCHCSSRFSPKSVQLPPSKSSKRSSRITAARLTAFGARAHSPSSPGRGV